MLLVVGAAAARWQRQDAHHQCHRRQQTARTIEKALERSMVWESAPEAPTDAEMAAPLVMHAYMVALGEHAGTQRLAWEFKAEMITMPDDLFVALVAAPQLPARIARFLGGTSNVRLS